MGFQNDKPHILAELHAGEPLLSAGEESARRGELSKAEAAAMVEGVRGHQAEASTHHFDPNQRVWILKPVVAGQRWYVKVYLDDEGLVVLSWHPSEGETK